MGCRLTVHQSLCGLGLQISSSWLPAHLQLFYHRFQIGLLECLHWSGLHSCKRLHHGVNFDSTSNSLKAVCLHQFLFYIFAKLNIFKIFVFEWFLTQTKGFATLTYRQNAALKSEQSLAAHLYRDSYHHEICLVLLVYHSVRDHLFSLTWRWSLQQDIPSFQQWGPKLPWIHSGQSFGTLWLSPAIERNLVLWIVSFAKHLDGMHVLLGRFARQTCQWHDPCTIDLYTSLVAPSR